MDPSASPLDRHLQFSNIMQFYLPQISRVIPAPSSEGLSWQLEADKAFAHPLIFRRFVKIPCQYPSKGDRAINGSRSLAKCLYTYLV